MKPVATAATDAEESVAKKAVTIRDVARHAGVSVTTASRALNGNALVNPETAARVMRVVAELEFSPSPAARRLSLGRTLTVGAVVSFLTRPQAAERIRGIAAVLGDSEFDLVIYNVESIQKRDHYLATLLDSHRVDGLLIVSLPPPAATAAALARSPVPIVCIDVHVDTVAAMPRVVGDDVAGGAIAARHLLELGHRRIGFVGDAADNPFGFTSSQHRETAFTRELGRAGVTIPAAWLGHGAHGRYESRNLALRMLAGADRPTAIFAASDTQALGVLAAAHEAGLNVPDDLSVIGYDDIEAADYVGLTTVRQQLFESGRRGAELLLGEIEQRVGSTAIAQLTPELVVRRTTSPPGEGRR
jgi:DNA-binding LacI/PurR family transcriptional regulator